MNDITKMELFPIPVFTAVESDFDELKKNILEYIKDYRDAYDSEQVSNIGGYQSASDIHEDVNFKSNCDGLWSIISPIAQHIGDSFAEHGFPSTTLSLTNMWFNVNGKGNWNIEHTHPHCFYSGVIWIKAEEGMGGLAMKSPHEHGLYGMTNTVWTIEPEEGRVMLFPSFLPHSVTANTTDEERISISFNLHVTVPL